MSRLCIFTDSYGWVAKATLWGKSQCKHSESQPHTQQVLKHILTVTGKCPHWKEIKN